MPRPTVQFQAALHDTSEYFDHPYFRARREDERLSLTRCRAIFGQIGRITDVGSLRAVTADGWLDGVSFRRGPHEGESYSLSEKEGHELFRSDMESAAVWQINRYGWRGGMEIQPDGLSPRDTAARYSSGDSRDHLSSPFVDLTTGARLVFFSLWTKPLSPDHLPELRLQDASFTYLAHARRVVIRPNGWILLAGWAEVPGQPQKVRLVVIQRAKTASLLDKAIILESMNPSGGRRTRNAP